jgi:hypothetical protein
VDFFVCILDLRADVFRLDAMTDKAACETCNNRGHFQTVIVGIFSWMYNTHLFLSLMFSLSNYYYCWILLDFYQNFDGP